MIGDLLAILFPRWAKRRRLKEQAALVYRAAIAETERVRDADNARAFE